MSANTLITDSKKYGSATYDLSGNISALHGVDLKVIHLPDGKGILPDYWQAWVNGTQDDGVTQNEAILNAFNRHESNRAATGREYFELGCLCILNGALEKCSKDVADWDAVDFYHKNCKCSRNYPA